MDKETLTELLTQVEQGNCPVDLAVDKLRHFPSESVHNGCIDHQRSIRTGIPEVIYGASKTSEQIITIAEAMLRQSGPVLATRVCSEKAETVQRTLPKLLYNRDAQMLYCFGAKTAAQIKRGTILVISAGTSDTAVAEEASLTAECFGNTVSRLYDAGVAGLHRLLSRQNLLHEATVIIVVAGMEGALPSVVGGLVSCPVIAVPTSVGYGASFGGIAALLGMLNSCAPGMAVVNIDNGFGAACMADAINRIE